MKKIDRYIALEMLTPFLFGLFTFSSILIGGSVLFPLISRAVKYGLPASEIGLLLLYQSPQVITMTFPMATLLASITAFNRMSSHRETVALRAAGISFFRMIFPAIVFSLIISCVHLSFNELIVPKANQNKEALLVKIKGVQMRPKENINLTEYDSEGVLSRIMNVVKIDGKLLKKITIAEFEEGKLSRILRAEKGIWNRGENWILENGEVHFFSKSLGSDLIVLNFEKEFVNIAVDLENYMNREKSVEELDAISLAKRIAFKKQTGGIVNRDLLYFHMKFSLPFASFVFCLLGASVGLRQSRQASSIGIGISVCVIVFYYILYSIALALAMANLVPAMLAAWIPNLVTTAVGLYYSRQLAYQ